MSDDDTRGSGKMGHDAGEDAPDRKTHGLSRRDFLGLGGAFALAASTGLLAGCASKQETSTPEPETATVDTSTESTSSPIEPVSAPSSWDYEADVVICGTGSGLLAAVRAASLGASVIVCEKSSDWGGCSGESSMFSVMGSHVQQQLYDALATELSDVTGQEKLAATLRDLADTDPLILRQRWLAEFCGRAGYGLSATEALADGLYLPDGTSGALVAQADLPMLRTLVNAIPNAIDFMADQGIAFSIPRYMGDLGYTGGLCYRDADAGGFIARANRTVFESLYNSAVDMGVRFFFNDAASMLVTAEDGSVVGVKLADDIQIHASKGVLLATGGMAKNQDMLYSYVPSVYQRALTTTVLTEDTGDGVRMGFGVGAALAGWDSSLCTDGGVSADGWEHYLFRGDVQIARQPWLGIDLQGNRYPYYPIGTRMADAQPGILATRSGSAGHVIFGGNYADVIAKWEADGTCQQGARRPITQDMGGGEAKTSGDFKRLPDNLCAKDYTVEVADAIASGYIVSGTTINELATNMSMPADTVRVAITNWNRMCAQGVDNEFHYDSAWLIPIEAPYYACRVGATCLSTTCGLAVLPSQQVIATNGQPIAGLYACGCTMGSGGASTFGTPVNPGGGVAFACGTAFNAANNIVGQ